MSKKETCLRYTGSMQQLAYVRPVTYGEGRAHGLSGFELKNGLMSMKIIADKCLDVSEFSYRGIQFNFLSKPGLQGRNPYDTNGAEAQRSIMGGLFFTCGMENVCAPCVLDGKDYPMHGRIRTTPAEHVSSDACWVGDDYVVSVSGEMREAELFGENLSLRREIVTNLGEKSFTLTDTICNEAFRDEPCLLLYHCNMGYPFLNEHSVLHLPSVEVHGREAWATVHIADWEHMEPAKDAEAEYVYKHRLGAHPNGDTLAMVENPALGLGLAIRFNRNQLSNFMQWKSIASGDYVLGLEPTNADALGRAKALHGGKLPCLKPMETIRIQLTFTVLDSAQELQACKDEIASLK